MKRMLLSFVVGVAVGALGHWYLQQEEGKRAVADARERVAAGAVKAKEVVLHGVDEIKEELLRTGRVVRDKATGAQAPADAKADEVTVSAVRARVLGDSGLASSKINVDSTNGVVTLSGTAANYEQIGRAMQLALDTAGVQRVVSLVQVSSSK